MSKKIYIHQYLKEYKMNEEKKLEKFQKLLLMRKQLIHITMPKLNHFLVEMISIS